MPKRIVWAMLKKRKRRKISMPKGMREKNTCQRAWRKEKKRKRQERNKDSPYFEIKGIPPKREIHDQRSTNILELGTL